MVIQQAYALRGYQIVGPDWISRERYDIVARTAAATPRERMMPMLRSLLAERFQLKFHRETKPMQGYALVVGKNGPKLRESKDEEAIEITGAKDGGISFTRASMGQLAGTLARDLNQPIEDATGLKGSYNFTLLYAPEQPRPSPNAAGDDRDLPALFTALQEQLG